VAAGWPGRQPGLHPFPWVGWLVFSEGSECKNSTHPPTNMTDAQQSHQKRSPTHHPRTVF
jgi:hypothetical protein